ncbi:MAG: EamA family transporter, partial [Crocinitomicaceae bacterium]|nr:EamA family transporter [Crocinitomicaceae bacterium]
MIFLLLSILFSSGILVIFKLFEKYNVNTFVAIVFNYLVAFSVGIVFFGQQWQPAVLDEMNWLPFAILIGILFISLFLLMGKSAQQNGIGITSVVVKMSLAIPVIFAIYLYQEAINLLKLIGVVAAIIGVLLITFQKKSTGQKKSSNLRITFLIVLFIGSGLLDTLINYVEKAHLSILTPALFSAISFGFAGLLGSMVLLFQL